MRLLWLLPPRKTHSVPLAAPESANLHRVTWQLLLLVSTTPTLRETPSTVSDPPDLARSDLCGAELPQHGGDHSLDTGLDRQILQHNAGPGRGNNHETIQGIGRGRVRALTEGGFPGTKYPILPQHLPIPRCNFHLAERIDTAISLGVKNMDV